jgi:hypothetical protein
MKLALARAMLMNADIMLLDEPTNHLDVTNVRWLVDYLVGLKGVTSVVVSHDSGFLDNVCSSIIHYEDNFKLKKYLGNLSKFVEQRPEAAAYYNLADATTKWSLPEPGYLEVGGWGRGWVGGWGLLGAGGGAGQVTWVGVWVGGCCCSVLQPASQPSFACQRRPLYLSDRRLLKPCPPCSYLPLPAPACRV